MQNVTEDELIDFTPELRQQALDILNQYQYGSLFTPPLHAGNDLGKRGAIHCPGSNGGTNIMGGASVAPETGILYQYSFTAIASLGLINDPERSDMDFILGRPRGVAPTLTQLSIEGLPLVKPPWGRMTAVDLNEGEILWQVPHGETPDNVREHPALAGVTIPRTGRNGRIGTLVTKTLLVAGEAGEFTTPSGARGAMLRAYDKRTGDDVGEVFMPAGQTGSPMSYMHDGQQYIVLAISGGGHPGELIAFRLPS